MALNVQNENSDKLWEGITLSPGMEGGPQETAGDAGGNHTSDVKTLRVRD